MAYAVLADLPIYGMPELVANSFSSSDREKELDAASKFADSYLATQYDADELPLTTYGVDLTQVVCKIAAYELLRKRGFDSPNEGNSFKAARDEAVSWLKDVSAGRASVSGGTTTASPEFSSVVYTSAKRGW